ncbi:MAG: response regulator [Rhodospirillaceae bacterium]|nr:response regulator [Rhodospirillaceae bacterium]
MKSCLIVEDSRVVRSVTRQILESLDFRVSEAENGRVALDECQRAMPDCILLDWNMPVMSGIEFLRALRGMDGAQPKVIFCTRYNETKYILQALEAGADEYIMKPFDGDILKFKLSRAGLL